MPFQDVEEDATVEVSEPSVIERLLRRVFLEDFTLKLLALGITLVTWFAVTGEKPRTIHMGVQLNFIRPKSLEISNDPPRTVDVLLTGNRHKLNDISLLDLVATVDLSQEQVGERVIRLSPQRVSLELPSGVKIESFQPSSIPVRLEFVVQRQLPIEVRLDGKPAEGYEVYGTQPTPSRIRVQGPASHVNDLQRAPTETTSVDGRKESFTVSLISIDIPDQKVEVLDPLVDLTIEIGERRVEKHFDNVSVRSSDGGPVNPSKASVTLMGVAHAIEQLRHEDIVVLVDTLSGGESTPKLQLPPAIQQQVKLISIKPTVFH